MSKISAKVYLFGEILNKEFALFTIDHTVLSFKKGHEIQKES